MASMWNCLLAAMLTVGRKARLLTVGRRNLAAKEPIGRRAAPTPKGCLGDWGAKARPWLC